MLSSGASFRFPPVDLATLDASPELHWLASGDGARIRLGAAWTGSAGGRPIDVPLEKVFERIHPDDLDAVVNRWAVATASGLPYSAQYRLRQPDATCYRWSLSRAIPWLAADGAVGGWVGLNVDFETERVELESSEARYRSLAESLPQLVALADAQGNVTYVNQSWRAYTGLTQDDAITGRWRSIVHPDDRDEVERCWHLATRVSREPLRMQYRLRRADGTYRWMLDHAMPVSDGSGEIVNWIATATDIDERKRAEDALRIASEAGAAFFQTLDVSVALQRLAEICVQHLADWCGVYVLDEGGKLHAAALAHREPERIRFVRDYLRRYPPAPGDPLYVVAYGARPLRLDRIGPELYETIADLEQRALAVSLGLRALLYVPLAADDRTYGVFALALAESERRFSDDDERLATIVAQRATIAIANARLFERQREVARTLQASFLPSALPSGDALAFDAVYVSATRDLSIGGDWYDAFPNDDGSIAFSLGDVAGHGLDAAVPMGKMRQTFRALAAVEDDPSRALAVADAALRREHPDVFVTAFAARYDPAAKALRYANAGHPAPFVRAATGALRRLRSGGVPLGLGAFGTLATVADRLAEGDVLVAFSDGLIEETRDVEEGEAMLSSVLAHAAFDICSTPAALVRALRVPAVPRDDVAILTLRVGGPTGWSFDANDQHAAQAARASFARRLQRAGISDDGRVASEIVFGEIVANAARYAPGRLDLGVAQRGDALVLTALDRGPGYTWSPAIPDNDSENGRGLFLIEALTNGTRIEYLAGFGTYLEATLIR